MSFVPAVLAVIVLALVMTGANLFILMQERTLLSGFFYVGSFIIFTGISFIASLGAEFMVTHAKELEKKVYSIPGAIDREIARLKLAAMGVKVDTLTPEQEKYLNSWEEGT